jgi:membrane fusion protein (multidrug efflux system)
MAPLDTPQNHTIAAVGASPARPGAAGGRKRKLIVALLLSGAAAAAVWGVRYWTVGRFLVSTDDAYVKADYTSVAPKVSGYVSEVLVADNQAVRAGQILARIDDRDFRAALAQAQADFAAADAAVRNIDAQLGMQRPIIEQARAGVAADEAASAFARQESERYATLARSGAAPAQRAQQTLAALREKDADTRREQAGLLAAESKLAVLATEHGKAEAQRARAAAALRQAELNLSYTTLVAPIDGTVGARALRSGQFVQAGTPLMAVVPLHAAYVVANFKETQLGRVRSGQPVEIRVDGLPGARLRGRVDSIAPASGLEFALLPPDNATGNFTKIVQRIPVKIVFDPGASNVRLRSGMSVEPVIDTRAAPTARAAAAHTAGPARG